MITSISFFKKMQFCVFDFLNLLKLVKRKRQLLAKKIDFILSLKSI